MNGLRVEPRAALAIEQGSNHVVAMLACKAGTLSMTTTG